MRLATYFLLFLGALPLLIYPFVFLASMMSLLGHRSGDEPALLMLVVYSFLLGSLAYPAVYVFCVALAIVKVKKNESKAALYYGIGPLGYLLLLLGLQSVEVEHEGKRFLLRSEVRGSCGAVFRAAGVAIPPMVQNPTT